MLGCVMASRSSTVSVLADTAEHRTPSVVRRLPVTCSPETLVAALRQGKPWAQAALFEQHVGDVRRVLARVMGVDFELPDLVQDVFLRAFESIERLNDPTSVKSWLMSIAVNTARERIRKRQRQRWLRFMGAEELPEVQCSAVDPVSQEALRATYAILDRLHPDERIAFALRFIDGMELTDVATACGVSLATIKRRLSKAGKRFRDLAWEHPVLREWLEGGTL